MAKREDRKSAIRSLVRAENIRTQKELVERLQQHGFDCTQATVSRDIAEMGFVKSELGFYALPEDIALKRLMGEHAIAAEVAGNLVVVKTRSGSASLIGEVLDNADIAGLVGTIAGDNTIMLAVKTEARASEIADHLAAMLR
ncbi:MAG: ArgR family transcriptional regulator [Coriobacteriaceae bacterium]|jgi:transcriptional regulator of arginine metabolism|nr:ArgR family transcriptional regulator [Coriobacteriaceae bacterium]